LIAKRWINRLVGLFDFYHLGADSFKLVNSVASQPLTPIQRQYCDTLATEVLQWCCLPTGLGLLRSGGRCAKFSVILNSISSSSYTNNACSPSLQALTTSALRVDPERIALPQQAGGVAPQDYLPEPLREHFLKSSDRILPTNLWEPMPKACHRIIKSDEVAFLLKLRSVGMGDFVSEQRLYRRDAHGKPILPVGGFFAVAHKADSDRLIYDRRPMNSLEKVFKYRARLPHGTCFTKLALAPSQTVRGSLDDLRCFFYCLQQPPGGELLNAVGRSWRGAQLPIAGLRRHCAYRFCLSVQGMGDHSAVDVAQHVHESVLRKYGCLAPHHHLHYDETVPASSTWEALYIDDRVVTQVLPLKHV
jgi:hypothetical protein